MFEFLSLVTNIHVTLYKLPYLRNLVLKWYLPKSLEFPVPIYRVVQKGVS